MLNQDANYKKLRVGGRSWLSQSSYWIGLNHLLLVEVINYQERYRRFYFRDVQAIIVQTTLARLWWNVGFGVFAGLALIGLVSSGWGTSAGSGLALFWLVLLLVFAACVFINSLRGASCSVHLQTAVQNQKLPGIGRWRKADAFVVAIVPLINSAQSAPTDTGMPVDTPATETPSLESNPEGATQTAS